MAKSIDERVVSMAFQNDVFEKKAAQTLATLAKLDSSIAKAGAVNGLSQIEAAANKVTLQQPMSAVEKLRARFSRSGVDAAQGMDQIENAGNRVHLLSPLRALDFLRSKVAQVGQNAPPAFNEIERSANQVSMGGLTSALDNVTQRFSVLQGAASVALGNISSQAIMRGTSFAKSFALGPLQQGFGEYQTNLKSIQTILANTEGQRVSGLDATNKALDELNHYADQTIYNFSEMAKNIGTFTAAGVDLPKSTASIKGIANLAALSGSSSVQASTAMYQLSQAIAAGRVSLQDWNSVVNAGMGGAKFQKALMVTAENMGALKKGAVEIDEATGKATVNGTSFRESIMAKPGQQSWLSADVLTKTLEQFTGDMTKAELAAQGFTEEQQKTILATAKTAKAAATEVKTLPQVFDVAREAIGSGWAKTSQLIFGDFLEAKKTFTAVSNAINGFINSTSDARNKLFGDWNKMGGRTVLLEGIKDGFQAIWEVIKPIGAAFRDIFPAQTAEGLLRMTKNFAALTKALKPSQEIIDGLRRTFRGLFALVHIGWSVLKGFIGVFTDLLGIAGESGGGFLMFTGSIGDFLVAIDKALTQGGLLTSFFETLSNILEVPLRLITSVASAIFSLFGGVDTAGADALSGGMEKINGAVGPLEQSLNGLKRAWDKLVDIFGDAKELVAPWLETIGNELSQFGSLLGEAIQTTDFDNVMSFLQTGFIGGIFLALKQGIANFGGIGDTLDGINGVLGGLTGNLEAMQKRLQAETLKAIAISIGILAASMFVLAKIDGSSLTKATTAMAVGMGQLVGAMAILGNVMKGQGKLALLTMPVIAVSLVGLATALVILSGAMKIFGTMDWDELAKGLVGVGGGLGAIAASMKFLGPGTAIQGPAILLLAIAMNALALAVKQFASLNWEELARGLAGVLFSLVALISPITLLGPSLILTGPGLIAVAFGLNMLAGAVGSFAALDPLKMVTGIGGIILALAGLAGAIALMPPTTVLQAAGLVVLAVALNGIAGAIRIMGAIGIENLIVGLTGMAGAMLILAVGLTAMTAAGPGALALMGAAAAFAVLGPALGFMGTLDIRTIATGLAAMAATLGVLAVVGALAAPGLGALGIALVPLALAFTVGAVGALAFAKALQMMAGSGAKGVGVMVTALTAFAAILPKILIDFAKGFVETIGEVAKLAPKVTEAIWKILDQIIQVVIQSTPRLAVALGILIDSFVMVIGENAPKIIAAGWKLLMDFLGGITQNLPQLLVTVGIIVTQFLTGLAAQAPKVIAAGGELIVAYISGITSQIPKIVAAAARAVVAFLTAVATRIGSVVAAGVRLVVSFLDGIAQNIGKVYAAGVRVIVSVLNGISDAVPRLIDKGVEIAGKFVRAVGNGLVRLASVGANAVIRFLNALADVIREKSPELRAAGWNLADAILDGMVDGFKELGHRAINAVTGVMGSLPGAAKKILGIKSPSRVFAEIGRFTMEGLSAGLQSGAGDPGRVMEATARDLVRNAENMLGQLPSALDGVVDADPVISPVLDLSAVEKEAQRLGGMTEVSPLKPVVSLEHAAAIADVAAAAPTPSDNAPTVLKEVKFEQTISSPDKLSEVEIYRNTRNFISAAKSELEVVP